MTLSTLGARRSDASSAFSPPALRQPDHEVHGPNAGAAGGPGPVELISSAGVLVVLVVAQLPSRLLEATSVHGWVLSLIAVVVFVSGARTMVRAPFALSQGSSTSQEVKTFVAATVAGTALTLPLYLVLRATDLWWLVAWAIFAAVTVAAEVAMPLVFRAQAGPLQPAPDATTRRVEALGARAGVDVSRGVFVAGTPKRGGGNAYVVGAGRARRIVLQGAVNDWPADLVDQVVAHEIGHWRLGHGLRRIPATLVAQLATFAAAGWILSYRPLLDAAGAPSLGDPRSYPLLVLLTGALALPARCLLAWRDRRQEREADRFALDLLQTPDVFAAMLDRAADDGGVPRALPWWRRLTASHPPIDERALACTRFTSTA